MLLAGYSTDIPAQALQVLETVLDDVLFNERKTVIDETFTVSEYLTVFMIWDDKCSSSGL